MTSLSIRIHAGMVALISAAQERMHREEGQDLLEYAMLGGLIAAGIVLVGTFVFKDAIVNMTTGIGNCIDFNSGTACKPGF